MSGAGRTPRRVTAAAETREMGRKIVHHDAPGILGWQTLCGHVDRTDYRWKETKAQADCHACLAVVAYAAAISKAKGAEA